MNKDELIHIWKKGNDLMLRDKKISKKMIMQYLNEKALKGSRSIHFNIIFYWMVQLANIILLSMNLAGYRYNPPMIWILTFQLVITIGILFYGIHIFYRLREINNFSESLGSLITRQLDFFRKSYEVWLFVSSVSAIILMTNVNLFIDNDNGTYVIHNRLLFVGVTIGALLFLYATQKISSLLTLRSLKAYLEDLERGTLDHSKRLEKSRRKYLWLWIAVLLLLTASLVFGLLKAIG